MVWIINNLGCRSSVTDDLLSLSKKARRKRTLWNANGVRCESCGACEDRRKNGLRFVPTGISCEHSRLDRIRRHRRSPRRSATITGDRQNQATRAYRWIRWTQEKSAPKVSRTCLQTIINRGNKRILTHTIYGIHAGRRRPFHPTLTAVIK